MKEILKMSKGVVWDMSSLFQKFNGPDMIKFKKDMKKGFADFQKSASETPGLNSKNQAKWEKLFLDAQKLFSDLSHFRTYMDCLCASDASNEDYAKEAAIQSLFEAEELKNEKRTLIFYEAPHKLLTTLADMLEVLGDRRISLCREMTKLNEEVIRTTMSAAITFFTENEPRGEFVLVVAGASKEEIQQTAFWYNMDVQTHVNYYVEQGMRNVDAVKAVARDRGVAKSVIYDQVLK